MLMTMIKSDIRALYKKTTALNILKSAINPSFQAVFFIRCAQYLPKTLHPLFRLILIYGYSIDIARGASIGKSFLLPHPINIVIGNGVSIGESVTLYQGTTLGSKSGGYPSIKNGVTIYPNCVIVGRIEIEENCTIGACTFLDKTIPEKGRVVKRNA